MGFIKSIETAVTGQYEDQFKEVIKCDGLDTDLLMRKVTTYNGVIQDKSRLYVQPGQCAILVDNGAIKDIISEPGMYFMDTSAPNLWQTNIFEGLGSNVIEGLKRIAYGGQTITTQAVYFISLAELANLQYKTTTNILYKDPEWGPMDIKLSGSYGIKVTNPVNLLTNVNSNADDYYFENLKSQIDEYISKELMDEMSSFDVSFDSIPGKMDDASAKILEDINKDIESLGLSVTRVVIGNIDVPEEIKKAMHERTGIKMKATSVDANAADVYTKLNTAEAIKDMANNQGGGNGTTIMGMNMGNTLAGIINGNINGAQPQNNNNNNNN
jgi:membrane protease subunit (stomatin/prohibitin family)